MNKHETNYFQHRAFLCWHQCLSGVKHDCFSVLWEELWATKKAKRWDKSNSLLLFLLKILSNSSPRKNAHEIYWWKSLSPSQSDPLSALSNGKSPSSILKWMTASLNNLSQQLPDHQRELGTENVKVQSGGNSRDFSEFLSPEVTHSGASPHHTRTALQGDRKHPDFLLTRSRTLRFSFFLGSLPAQI